MTDEPLPPDLDVVDNYPSGLKITTERPYRILLITDLAGGETGGLSGPLAEHVADLTPETFDELLAAARPTVSLRLADPVSPTHALTELELSFRSLKDFAPQAVLQQIAGLRGLLDAREQIVARLRGKLSTAQLAEGLKRVAGAGAQFEWLLGATHWTPGAAPAPESAVDDLLGQLDLGDEAGQPPAPPRKTPLGAAVAAAAAGGGAVQIPAEEASALRRTFAQIDQQLAAWLSAVLHSAAVQRVEGSWRSLALLVSRFDFRKGVRLSVLHARREELTQRLVSLVIDPVFDAGAEAPDLIVVNENFGNAAPDLETLDELAQHAASLPVVVLAGAGAEFFGLKHAWQVPSLPPLVTMFDQWQFAKWKTLREQPYARALGVVFGRGLLRAPYAAAAGDDLAFQYREECVAEKDALWTSGAVAAACTIAAGVATMGWPTGIVGRLEGLPVARGGKKGEKQLGPTDTVMPLEKGQELAMVGLNAVLCPPNQTDACVCGGFSAARPTRAEGTALLEVSLPYQLFASRLSTLLLELKPHLAGLSDEKLAAFVLTHVRDWLTVADVPPEEQQIAVQAKPLEDNPNSLQLAVTVTPPPQILPGGVPVVLGYRVR